MAKFYVFEQTEKYPYLQNSLSYSAEAKLLLNKKRFVAACNGVCSLYVNTTISMDNDKRVAPLPIPFVDSFGLKNLKCHMCCRTIKHRGSCDHLSAVWPDLAIDWTLGNFLKPLATINLPKSPTFICIFCKGVKIYNFSSEIIFGQLL